VCTNSLLNRTMATTIEQQVALDEALVPSTKRLRVRRSNFRLPSDIQSKESTLQVYMMFCVDLLSSRHSLLQQMYLKYTCRNSRPQLMFINTPSDSKWTPERTLSIWKHLGRCCISVLGFRVNLLMLPFEEEILDFLWFLGHSA
nr:hypothetical protein [Tanacetum cinerariifolium]